MAVIHDLGEAEVGDIPKRAVDVETNNEEKEAKERKAIENFSGDLGDSILDLWQEYEKREIKRPGS